MSFTNLLLKSLSRTISNERIKKEDLEEKARRDPQKLSSSMPTPNKSGVNNDSFHMSMETSTKSIWNLIKPIKLNKKKNKAKK